MYVDENDSVQIVRYQPFHLVVMMKNVHPTRAHKQFTFLPNASSYPTAHFDIQSK